MASMEFGYADGADVYYDNPPQPFYDYGGLPIIVVWYVEESPVGETCETFHDIDGDDDPDEFATCTEGFDDGDKDPIIFGDVIPPVRQSDIDWMQEGVQLPDAGPDRGPRAAERSRRDRWARGARWERRRERMAMAKELKDLEEMAAKGRLPKEPRRRPNKLQGRPPTASSLPPDLALLLPYTFASTPPQARAEPQEARREKAGKLIFDRDEIGVMSDVRFCRRAVFLRRKHFRLSDEAQRILEASSRWRHPVLHHRSRKAHNKSMHAINGNGARAPDVDVVSSTEHESVSDTCGDVGGLGCYILSAAPRGARDSLTSSLLRSALSSSGVEELSSGEIVLFLNESREYLTVIPSPRVLGEIARPVLDEMAHVVAVVDLALPRDRLSNAVEHLAWFSEHGWPCVILMGDVHHSTINHTVLMGMTRLLLGNSACALWCEDCPPAWSAVREGLRFSSMGHAEAPWIDIRRLARLTTTVIEPAQPGYDAPASWATVRGPALSVIERVPASTVVTLTTHRWAFDLEISGVPPYRGVWIDEGATVYDLLRVLQPREGAPIAWRFVANGRQIDLEVTLASLRPHTLRLTPLLSGGAPKKAVDGPKIRKREDKQTSAADARSGRARGSAASSWEALPAVAAAAAGEPDAGFPTITQMWAAPREEIILSPTAPVILPRIGVSIVVKPPRFPPQLTAEDPATVAVPPDGRCLYYCILAGYGAREWVATHKATGWAHDRQRQMRDERAAQALRERFIAYLKARGQEEDAARLTLEGTEGCPTQDDMCPMADMLEGGIVLQDGEVQIIYGDGPLLLHLACTISTDAQNHSAAHYELIQSWMAVETAPASPDAIARSSRSRTPARRLRGKTTAASLESGSPRVLPRDGSVATANVFTGSLLPHDVANVVLGEEREEAPPEAIRTSRAPSVASPIDVEQPDGELGVEGDEVLALLDVCEQAVPEHTMVENNGKTGKHDIVQQVENLWKIVRTEKPLWETCIQHLSVAALAVYLLRQPDVDLHEEVLMLYVVEGGRFARAHNGVFYSYTDAGAFEHYQGVVACECISRVKRFMRPLEGVFRCFRGNVLRAGSDVLNAIERAVSENGGTPGRAMERFHEVALQAVVTYRERRGPEDRAAGPVGGADAESLMQDEGPQDANLRWYLRTANLVARLSASLCSSLLHVRIFTFFTEWCDTPHQAEAGAAFSDACLKLLDSPGEDGKYTRLVPKGPEQNIYLYIAHPLLDPVAAAATARVRRFYRQTFWRNAAALECQLCALCLAFRGRNVDRAFWGVGPGGVGQSLFSSHLAALLGRRHAFLDTNVFHTDDELRKQADAMLYSIVITGQEAVENASKPMRQDIYKKVVTADPIPSRLPYAIVTKLVELVGWKRLELNTLLRFTGITDKTFWSVFRRAWVMEYRATFIDVEEHARDPAGHTRAGRFPQDHTLRDFLRSGPAVAATLKMMWGFMSKTSPDACTDAIERYVLRGGDSGLTWASMRLACGLPPAPMRVPPTAPPQAPGATSVKSEQPAVVVSTKSHAPFGILADARQRAVAFAAELLDHMLEDSVDSVSHDYVGRRWTPAAGSRWASVTRKSRPGQLDTLVSMELFRRTERLGFRNAVTYIPVITSEFEYDAVVPSAPAPACPDFQEELSLTALTTFLDCAGRLENAEKTHAFVASAIKKLNPTMRGNVRADTLKRVEALQKRLRKMDSHDNAAVALAEKLRHVKRTTPEAVHMRGGQEYVITQSSYSTRTATRGRRYVDGVGAQGLSRALLQVVCPDTVDLDIRVCMFNILVQLLDKFLPRFGDRVLDFPMLRRIASDRASVCADMGLSEAEGKHILTAVANGQHVEHPHPVLLQLARDARLLRWWACSLRPSVYSEAAADLQRAWPEATTLFHVWSPVEDLVLECWAAKMRSVGVAHLSLHFDGLRLRPTTAVTIEELISMSEAEILKATGYSVVVVNKTHRWVREILMERSADSAARALELRAPCIPVALLRLRPQLQADIVAHAAVRSPVNLEAEGRGLRRYRDWDGLSGTKLRPHVGLPPSVRDDFLLHLEGDGRPHCVAVQQVAGGVRVIDGSREVTMTHAELRSSVATGLDGSHVVSFTLTAGIDMEPGDTDLFLDLLAGTGDSISSSSSATSGDDNHADRVDEATTDVGLQLYSLMELEKRSLLDARRPSANRRRPAGVQGGLHLCPLCPLRGFDRVARLTEHVVRYHTRSRRYCPSGVKQARVAAALWDSDALSSRDHKPDYLRRSADVLRRAFPPDVDAFAVMEVDHVVRLLLDDVGPAFIHVDSAIDRDDIRRVGNIYLTHSFAEEVYRLALMHQARTTQIYVFYCMRATASGNDLVSLVPKRASRWWHDVLSDIMTSRAVGRINDRMLTDMVRAQEYISLSVDATVKPCLSLLGQATYRAAADLRAKQARPDSKAKYRVLTIRGRSSAPVLLRPVYSEAISIIAEELVGGLPEEARLQVEHIAMDDIKCGAWLTLRAHLPKLRFLSLDPTHLVMMYKAAHWKKPTEGTARALSHSADRRVEDTESVSLRNFPTVTFGRDPNQALDRWLSLRFRWKTFPVKRTIVLFLVFSVSAVRLGSRWLGKGMAKLMRRRPGATSSDFGEPYQGEPVVLTSSETRLVRQLREGSMPKARAQAVFRAFVPDAPWASRYHFLEWLTAFMALYAHEMRVPTARGGRLLANVMASMVKPEKLEWLHACPTRFVRLLPTGTCSNEALHSEMRAWFRNVQCAHLASLNSRLRVFQHAKVLAHHAAVHHPTTRMELQAVVLARVCGGRRLWTECEWKAFASEQDRLGRFRLHGKSQPSLEFRRNQSELRVWKKDDSVVVRQTRKRPAGSLGVGPPPEAPPAKTRRSVFRLERSIRVVRPLHPVGP